VLDVPSRVDLESLRLLLAIADEGSLGAAARTLGISQPAASQRLRVLERRYQLRLIARSPRGSRLTTDGQVVYSWAQRVLHEVDALETGMRALSEQRAGDLRIAASLTIAEYFLPGWLAELQHEQPHVRLSMQVRNSEVVIDSIRRRGNDVGFIEQPGVPGDLESTEVGQDRLVVVVRPDHPWVTRTSALSTDELVASPLVLREPGSGTRRTFEAALGAPPLVALEASSTSAVIGAAISGVGAGVVSEVAVRSQLEAGFLVCVPTQLDLRRTLRAVWRRDTPLSPPARALITLTTRRPMART
jgi:molybdate transport repressor ModE-like protein